MALKNCLSVFILLITSHTILRAQHCDFENYGVIIVKIQEQKTGAFVHGLHLSLVYGNDSPLMAVRSKDEDNVFCSEPYIFWENTDKNTKASETSMH